MFFPLGFGNWPRLFPFAIAIISVICIGWSLPFFSVLKTVDKKIDVITKKFSDENLATAKLIFRDSCDEKYKASEICDLLSDKMTAKRLVVSEDTLKKIQKMPGSERLERIVNYVGVFYEKEPAEWPKEVRNHESYEAFMAKYNQYRSSVAAVFKEYDLTSGKNLSLMNIVRASFTHADFGHLFGNLLVLIIFGVWVDQRMGLAWTSAVFLIGGFAGLLTQALAHPDHFVLGASAGISALMGAFFAFFYWAEFHFLFALGFFYFKRVVMPLLWVFPAFYVMADFTAVVSGEASGVAHLAHLVGFLFGCGFGFLHQKLYPIAKGHLFAQEAELISRLRSAEQPAQIWGLFSEIMKWNAQNNEAADCFLVKGSLSGVALQDEKDLKQCNRYVSDYMRRCFKSGSVKDIIIAVEHFPPNLPLANFISDVPLRQILQVADFTAQKGYYSAALVLYRASISKLKEPKQMAAVNQSINAILELNHLQLQKVNGGF